VLYCPQAHHDFIKLCEQPPKSFVLQMEAACIEKDELAELTSEDLHGAHSRAARGDQISINSINIGYCEMLVSSKQ
jgi:hypothetical protein